MATKQHVNNFYNAWKEQHSATLFVVDPDTVRMQNAVITFTRCVCNDDVKHEWDRVYRWWYALTGDELSVPPCGFIADRFERAYNAMAARMTSIDTRRANQESAEQPANWRDVQ